MPTERLTTTLVRDLRPSQRQVFVYDDQVRGLAVRVSTGGTKAFVFSYRVQGTGRERLMRIGRWGTWSVQAARDEAKKLRRRVDRGEDPMGARHEVRTAPTMADLLDRYLREHVLIHNKPNTVAVVTNLVDNVLKRDLGTLKVAQLTREEVSRWHSSLKSTPYRANLALTFLRKALNLAEVWGYRADGSNPCRHVTRFKERARERFLDDTELSRLGVVLRAGKEDQAYSSAITLLLFTGCRVMEVLGLRWSDIDLKAGTFKLEDAKSGGRTVVLSSPAMEVLAGLDQSGDFAFVPDGEKFRKSYDRLNAAWKRITRDAEIENATLHCMRHTFGTVGGSRGLNAFTLRDLLGHRTLSMTARYVAKDHDPMRKATEAVSATIAAALEGREEAEVVSMK